MKKFILTFIIGVSMFACLLGNSLKSAQTATIAGNCLVTDQTVCQNNVQITALNNQTELEISAKSAFVCSANAKTVVYEKNSTAHLPIASMTKIMLLNLVFDAVNAGKVNLTDNVVVSERAQSMGGSQVFLRANGNYKLSDLIKSIIVSSANDSSVAVAEYLFGSEQACVVQMNDTAKAWGMENTLFVNCTGLPKETQYSCAKDVAVMLSKLITHKEYFDYSKIYLDEIEHEDGQKTMMTNTNKLIKRYAPCDGGKTGYTTEAKFCLASTACKNDTRLITVVIGEDNSTTRFNDSISLFDYGFSNFINKQVLTVGEKIENKIAVKRGVKKFVDCGVESNVECLLKNDEKAEFSYEFLARKNLQAPINKGDKVGEVTIFKNGVEFEKKNLVALETVSKRKLFWIIG